MLFDNKKFFDLSLFPLSLVVLIGVPKEEVEPA